ncbi:hypothetical protein HDU81_007919 [Chytriomyces hyalinus]|nr:hypothetical protein HDU81_007919 [Chytriomyces hyalinus]
MDDNDDAGFPELETATPESQSLTQIPEAEAAFFVQHQQDSILAAMTPDSQHFIQQGNPQNNVYATQAHNFWDPAEDPTQSVAQSNPYHHALQQTYSAVDTSGNIVFDAIYGQLSGAQDGSVSGLSGSTRTKRNAASAGLPTRRESGLHGGGQDDDAYGEDRGSDDLKSRFVVALILFFFEENERRGETE